MNFGFLTWVDRRLVRSGDRVAAGAAALAQAGATKRAPSAGIVLAAALVGACTGTLSTSPAASIATSPAGAAVIHALVNNLAPGVNAAIAKHEAAAQHEIAVMREALPWADKALVLFGPSAGRSATTIAELRGAIVATEVILANPPGTVGDAVARAGAAYNAAIAALRGVLAPAPS